MDGDGPEAVGQHVHDTPLEISRILAAQWLELGHTLRQADLKAQVLLGVDAVLLTGLVGLDAGASMSLSGASGLLAALSLAALLGSVAFALLTVLPRQGHSATEEDVLLYFGGMASLPEDDFIDRYMALSLNELKRLVLADLHAQAIVATRKFRGAWLSMVLLGPAVVLWISSRLVG